jgi:hypothetical protein
VEKCRFVYVSWRELFPRYGEFWVRVFCCEEAAESLQILTKKSAGLISHQQKARQNDGLSKQTKRGGLEIDLQLKVYRFIGCVVNRV